MEPLPQDLAASLAAAHDSRAEIHFDICTVYSKGRDYGCTCGIPTLIADLFRFLGVEELDWRTVLYSSGGKGFAQSA